jgi:hypothetical protein
MKAKNFLAIIVCLAFGLMVSNAAFAQNENKKQQQSPQEAKQPSPPSRKVNPPQQPARSQTFQQPSRQASSPDSGYQPQPQPKSSPQQYPASQSAQQKGYIPANQQTPAHASTSVGPSSPKPGYQVSPSSSSVKPAPFSPSPPVAKAPQSPQTSASVPAAQPYQLVKSPNNPTVYILKDGKKYAIQGADDFNALGLDWNKIQTIPSAQLNSMGTGGFINKTNVANYSQQLLGQQIPASQSAQPKGYTPPSTWIMPQELMETNVTI